ncbi:MAG: apolipoprotein N-acyltransferase [Armatimonadetes bacterium]|nr:apolipoprotein N-acyltransferase [Akkermansiaceae bacterium]
MSGRVFFLRLSAIIATGLMTAGLFPPYNFSWLAWICVLPMLIALWSIKGSHRAKKGFLIGFLAGALGFSIQLSWIGVVSWLGAILLPLYLGFFWGIFGAFAASAGNPWQRKNGILETPLHSLITAFTHATIWAGLEWFRGWFLTGFGWNGLGVAFHDSLAISQAADLLGVTGLSLMLVFFQAILLQVGHRALQTRFDGKRRPQWDFILTALGIGILAAYGLIRISLEKNRESIPLKSLLVQINIPQDAGSVLWSMEKIHMAYEDETLEALKSLEQDKTPDWVLWPETALNGRIIRADDGAWGAWWQNTETINRVRDGGRFDLIYGVVEIEGEGKGGELFQKENPRIYNSIAVQTADDELETFRKRHLVIFGETIPFVDSIPFLKQIYEQQAGAKYTGSFTAGPSLDPLPIMLKGIELQIIPSVCFEDTVPRLTRKFVRNAPQVIVNLTNDGWFKESAGAAQHFANARFRAIELRRPMLRCANTGVSAAINTIGSTDHPQSGKSQIIADSKGSTFVRGSLLTDLEIPLRPGFSLYVLIGDWGIIGLFLVGIAAAIIFRTNQKSIPADAGPSPSQNKIP